MHIKRLMHPEPPASGFLGSLCRSNAGDNGRYGTLPTEMASREWAFESIKAVSQLLWPDKDREEWFSLGENHEKAYRFGVHQLRNCFGELGQG